METYFGIALAALIVFAAYRYISARKARKGTPVNTGGGGGGGGEVPPRQEKKVYRSE